MSQAQFIGRKNELSRLSRLLTRRSASTVTITGRRRIGKSRLIEEFAKNKNLITISGLPPSKNINAQNQRDEFARQLADQFGIPLFTMYDWGDLFLFLSKQLTPSKRQIVMLDEISWMGSLDPNFLGKLKIAWDLYFKKHPKLILIFCGSVSTWIEQNIIGSTGFLGRISLKIRLQPLSLTESLEMLESIGYRKSLTEKLMVLCVTGGVPWYIEQISRNLSAEKNIHELCFEPDGLLVEEFQYIFNDLFERRSNTYQAIVERLSKGPAEYGQIAQDINFSAGGTFGEYLSDLELSGFITSNKTWNTQTGKHGRLIQYRINDCYLRFYLMYILPNLDKILAQRLGANKLWELDNINTIMGLQLETLLLSNRNLIWNAIGLEPTEITTDNPYFQRKTLRQKGCQIDYLIQTKNHTFYLIEFKFSRNPLGKGLITEVKLKLNALKTPENTRVLPVLVHVNGVTEELKNENFFDSVINLQDLVDKHLPMYTQSA